MICVAWYINILHSHEMQRRVLRVQKTFGSYIQLEPEWESRNEVGNLNSHKPRIVADCLRPFTDQTKHIHKPSYCVFLLYVPFIKPYFLITCCNVQYVCPKAALNSQYLLFHRLMTLFDYTGLCRSSWFWLCKCAYLEPEGLNGVGSG